MHARERPAGTLRSERIEAKGRGLFSAWVVPSIARPCKAQGSERAGLGAALNCIKNSRKGLSQRYDTSVPGVPACRGGECRVRLEILRPGTASDRLNCLPDRAQLSRGSIQARNQSANPRWPKRPTQRACPVGLVTAAAAAGCRLRLLVGNDVRPFPSCDRSSLQAGHWLTGRTKTDAAYLCLRLLQ